jgi:hypothetical protein
MMINLCNCSILEHLLWNGESIEHLAYQNVL